MRDCYLHYRCKYYCRARARAVYHNQNIKLISNLTFQDQNTLNYYSHYDHYNYNVIIMLLAACILAFKCVTSTILSETDVETTR